MATFKIIADDRTLMADRDAYAVTVRVERDGEDLGLWQTWISGFEDRQIDNARPAITKLQRRRIAAELLAEAVKEQVRAHALRDQWQLEVEVLRPTTARAVTEHAGRALHPAADFRAGDVIDAFDV